MRKIVAGLSALAVIAFASLAFSHAGGTSGTSGKQNGNSCTSCHTGGMGNVEVEIVGPRKLDAGTTGDYRFYVRPQMVVDAGDAGDGGDGGEGGIYYYYTGSGANIAADDTVGLVASANGGLKGVGEELTHISPMAIGDAGEAIYHFQVKAPQYGGYYTLFAAGNGVNMDNTPNGDRPALTTYTVQVLGPAKPGTDPQGGGTGPGTGPGTGGGGTQAPEEPHYGNAQATNDQGGCDISAVGNGSALGALFLIPALAIAAARRRRNDKK